MKKVISLVLVFSMILVCFAGCKKKKDKDFENPTPPTASSGTGSTSARATVTEEEWRKNFEAMNFTVNFTRGEEVGVLKQSEDAYYQNYPDVGERYYAYEDGQGYMIRKNGDKWVGVKDDWDPNMLASRVMKGYISFNLFTYDEESKTYSFYYESDMQTITVSFKRGVIQSMTITYDDTSRDSITYTFSKIGSTHIDVPEYEKGAGDTGVVGGEGEVRTTVTEAEWYGNLSAYNFTLKIRRDSGNLTLQQTEERYCATGGGMPCYFTLLDKAYRIENTADGWVAFEDTWIPAQLSAYLVDGDLDLYDFTLEEKSQNYCYYGEDVSIFLYFEWGVLKSARVMYPEYPEMNMSCEVINVGSTVIELPNFEFSGK